jgi:cold-inducible RNA-binding protein
MKPGFLTNRDTAITTHEEKVRVRAYELYEVHGRMDGHAEEDWLQAEGELAGSSERKAAPASASGSLNIFVGNLDFTTSEEQLQELFAAYGAVETVTIVTDRDTGQPRGFAFVEMTSPDEAQDAIRTLNGSVLGERAMIVNEARPKVHNNCEHESFTSRDHRRHRF